MSTLAVYAVNTTNDGVSSNNANYSSSRSGSNLAVQFDNGSGITGQQKSGNYYTWQQMFRFSTSSLGSGATISAVSLQLYGASDNSTTDFTIEVWRITLGGAAVATTDWVAGSSLSGLTRVATFDTSGGFSITGYNTFTEDGTNFQSNVNKTGNTDILVASSRQNAGNAPTGDEYIQIRSPASSGNTKDPLLTVTYTNVTNYTQSVSGISGTLSGVLTTSMIFSRSLSGAMGTVSAILSNKTLKSLSGATGSLVASLVLVTQKALSGVSGSLSGGIQKIVYRTLNGLSGLVSGSLTVSHVFSQLISGAAGIISGVISKTTQKSLSGQINSIVGTLAKLVSKILSGTSGSMSGALSRQLVKIVNLVGVVGTVSATLTRSTIKTVSGTLNQIVGSLSRGFLKNVSLSGVLNSFSGNVGWYGIVKRAKMKAGEVSATTIKAGTLAAGTVMKAGSVLVTRLRGGWRNK